MKISLSINIDTRDLSKADDSYLAQLWHVAQANQAPTSDHDAVQLVRELSDEIIRRWLISQRPELHQHQGHDYYWSILQEHGRWTGTPPQWTPNGPEDADDQIPAPDHYSVGVKHANNLHTLAGTKTEHEAIQRLSESRGTHQDMLMAAYIYQRCGFPETAEDIRRKI